MFPFLKKTKTDPYEVVQEKWKTNFGFLDKKRFVVQKEETYESGLEKNHYFLSLHKQNHFAWALSELCHYNNFCLEGDVEFHKDNGYSAAGFIFRYINMENFYYFLISNKGFFRFDVVFNGNPMTRIDWTESPHISDTLNSIRIIARDSYFSFYVDDEWIGELEDETLFKGYIGFAAQNFDEKESALFYMNTFSIESRNLEIEKHFERWTQYIPQEPEARIRLAKTLYTMEAYSAAAIQMKKAMRNKKPDPEDYFLFGEMCMNMRMYPMALETMEKCIELDPARLDAIQEKANILYITNRFIDARDHIAEHIPRFNNNATIWNLLGNCEYAIGNFDKALAAYEKAFSIQPAMPLFIVNAARAAEMNKDKEKAIRYYLNASRLFYQTEAYDELYPVFASLEKLDSVNSEVKALAGKILFRENKFEQAEDVFNQLINDKYEESSVFYLRGIILKNRGDIKKALKDFKKACALEDTFYLYWLRLGEVKFIEGQNPKTELKKALDLAPENPWVLNQYGLFLMNKGKYEEAQEYFSKALKNAPGEADIAINLSQNYYKQGNAEQAFAILESDIYIDNPKIMNQKGNLYTREKKYEAAIGEYKKAVSSEPENPVYLENCAKACIEIDMIMQAEEYLTKLFNISPTASVHNLIGYLALIKREWVRAGVAFKEGLDKDPDNIDIMINLASLYLDRSDYATSKEWIARALAKDPENSDARAVENSFKKKFEEQLLCATCNREWWVPKNVPLQSLGRIYGEPPGAAPAGKCESCGKIYCIECAQNHLKDKRFVCPDCDTFLKLSDNWLKYLLLKYIKEAEQEATELSNNINTEKTENSSDTGDFAVTENVTNNTVVKDTDTPDFQEPTHSEDAKDSKDIEDSE